MVARRASAPPGGAGPGPGASEPSVTLSGATKPQKAPELEYRSPPPRYKHQQRELELERARVFNSVQTCKPEYECTRLLNSVQLEVSLSTTTAPPPTQLIRTPPGPETPGEANLSETRAPHTSGSGFPLGASMAPTRPE